MTIEEAIEILIAVAVCDRPILSCDFCARYVGMGTDCTYPSDKEIEESVLLLKGASNDAAISALRQHGVPGKDVGNNDPLTLDDAIAHLDDTLSDTGRKWSCESCRMEHVQLRAWLAELRDIKQKRNAPLTLDDLRTMDGEPVWWWNKSAKPVCTICVWDRFMDEPMFANYDWQSEYTLKLSKYKWLKKCGYKPYRQNPEEGTV